jgi:hypothetical protein
MAADLINLNKTRKAKAKDARKTEAVHNRAKFGQGKAERARTRAEADKARRALDDSKRES